MSGDEQVRVGTAEREQALSALADHHAAGRLDADEYEDRRGRANDAVTRHDLDDLFTDLPGGKPESAVASASDPVGGSTPTPVNRDERRAQRWSDRANGTRGGRSKQWRGVVALSPFVALVLFFITKSWLWFLLVPAAGIVAGMFGRDDA